MSGLRLGLPFFPLTEGTSSTSGMTWVTSCTWTPHYLNGQRDALGINKDVDLRASLAAICRIRPGFLAAAGGLRRRAVDQRARPVDRVRTVELSQEHCVEFLNHPFSVPLLEPTRQVIPEPHPSSVGISRHGMPVHSPKVIPVRTLRSSMGLRPG